MKIVNYHSDHNCATALVIKQTKTYLFIIQVEPFGLRVRKIPVADEKNFTELEYHGKPYPLKRAVRLYKKYGKKYGITKPARKALNA